jgi:hypothetical protein
MQGVLKFVRSIFSWGVVVGVVNVLVGIFTWNIIPFVIGVVGITACLLICRLFDRFIRS